MKNSHIIPFPVYFLKIRQKRKDYTNPRYNTQLDCHKVTFKLAKGSLNPIGRHNLLLKEFQAALNIYHPKHIQELNLCFSECPELDATAFKNIGLGIKRHFKNLKKLNLSFYECDKITHKGFQQSLQSIRKNLKSLNELNLSFICCSAFNDQDAEQIRLSVLQCINNLCKLSLVISGEKKIVYAQGFFFYEPNINKKLEDFNSLNQWTHTVKPNRITDRGLKSLCYSLGHYLRNLQQLVFVFPATEKPKIGLICPVIRSLRKLKKLYLGFTDSVNAEEEEIGKISSCIGQNLRDLKYLAFYFGNPYLADERVLAKLWLNTLPSLPQLRGFALSFGTCDKKGLSNMIKHTCLHSKNLESLILDIETVNGFDDQTVQKILYQLSLNLLSLKELTLNFKSSSNIVKDPLKEIPSSHFQSLKGLHLYLPCYQHGLSNYVRNLEQLTLSLERCAQMSVQEFKDNIEIIFIPESSSLRKLALTFGAPWSETEDIMTYLCDANWACLSNLQEFKLVISRCSLVTDAFLNLFGRRVCESLTNLTTLEMSFIDCEELSNTGIKSFSQRIIQNLNNLENLTFDFYEDVGLYDDPRLDKKTIAAISEKIVKHGRKLRKLSLGLSFKLHKGSFRLLERNKLSFIPIVDLY